MRKALILLHLREVIQSYNHFFTLSEGKEKEKRKRVDVRVKKIGKFSLYDCMKCRETSRGAGFRIQRFFTMIVCSLYDLR